MLTSSAGQPTQGGQTSGGCTGVEQVCGGGHVGVGEYAGNGG